MVLPSHRPWNSSSRAPQCLGSAETGMVNPCPESTSTQGFTDSNLPKLLGSQEDTIYIWVRRVKRKGKTIGATKTQGARSCDLTTADPLPSKFLFV